MKSKWRAWALFEALADLILLALGYALSLLLLFGTTIPEHNVTALRDTLPLACLAGFILLAFYGVYADRYRPFRETVVNLAAAIGLLAVGVSALAFFVRGFAFPRFVLVTAPVFHMVFLTCWHGFQHLRRRQRRGIFRVLVIGPQTQADAEHALLLRKLEKSLTENRLMRMSQWISWEALLETDTLQQPGLMKVMAPSPGMDATAPFAILLPDAEDFDGVLLCTGAPDAIVRRMALLCAQTSKTLMRIPSPADILLTGSDLRQLGDTPVLALEHAVRRPELQWAKRLTDMLFAGILLLAASPLFLLTALLVRVSGSGPILFSQERVTQGNRTFRLYKFRTMIHGAEDKTGPVLSTLHDARITPVGRFLRKARLDELPQLWNILMGDMSVVGPRPERPVFVARFEQELPGYELRHTVRSGLTGLAQVHGNYSTSAGDKLAFDLLYIRDWSLLLDLQIVLRTVTAVFRREAAEGVRPDADREETE